MNPKDPTTEPTSDEALDRLLAVDEDEPPRPGFDTRFFARLDEHRAASQRPRWLPRLGLALGGFAAAAAVALFVVTRPGGLLERPSQEELAMAMELELLEDLELVANLEVVEAYEALAAVLPNEPADEVTP